MGTRRALGSSSAIVVLAACIGADSVGEVMITAPPLVAAGLVADRPERLDDTLGLSQPTDLVPIPEGYVVVDSGNDRLVVFDTRLEPVRTVARAGAGPAELQGPIWASRTLNGVAVVEFSNGRVSLFDERLLFQRTVKLPVLLARVTVLADGSMVLPSPLADARLSRVDVDGRAEPFGPRRLGARASGQGPEAIVSQDLVVRAGDELVHLNADGGRVHRLDAAGRTVGSARLPEDLIDPARAYAEASASTFRRQGLRIVGTDLFSFMTTQPDGRVWIQVAGHPEYVALLFDPRTFEGRYVTAGGGAVAERLRSARAGVLEGHMLTVLRDGGLSRIRLSEHP